MLITELKEKDGITENAKLNRIYIQFGDILRELRKKELPDKIIESVNQDIDQLNSSSLTGNELRKLVKKKQTNILKLLEKEVKIVPKNHYQNLWLVVGMTAFGVPIGMTFGLGVTGNASNIAIGLPIGMAIGYALGLEMDKKAFKEGRQLDVKIKY